MLDCGSGPVGQDADRLLRLCSLTCSLHLLVDRSIAIWNWGVAQPLFSLKMEEAVFPPLPPSYPQGERRCCHWETSQARSPRHQDTMGVISSPMSSFPFTEPPPWLCLSRSGCFLTEKAVQLLSGNHFTHCRQHLRKGWCRSCLALPPVSCHCPQQAIGALTPDQGTLTTTSSSLSPSCC